ncbi:ATP-binding protein [Oceanimonas sp. CHS3-5]|uniref:sensor histidine kinase n=1 Tax=Oceanimonas sp. CHS3-5 TaxID=3068186 RepID=UPI00273D94D7|nr:ATP-binding protein [Oceanimonas sp. CHS3-5]MDP5292944.1 ATP-binding protein [Oceanimonas sp. CHS3-5]
MGLSLKGRIALIMLTGALLTVLGVLATAYHSLVDDFEQLYSQRQFNATVRAAEQVEQALALRQQTLESLSPQLSNGISMYPLAGLLARLERHSALQRLFPDGVMVFDANATAIAETTPVPGRLGTNYADRAHFKALMRTHEAVISHPIVGRTTGTPLVSFLSPILSDDGDLLGILGGVLNLAKTSILPEQRLTEALREGVNFRILDTENQVYVYNGRELASELQPLPPPGQDPLIDAALAGERLGVIERHGEKQWVYATTHLQQLGWLFVRALPHKQVVAPARAFFMRFAGISVLIGAGLALVAFWMAWSAMRPLEAMTRRIHTMASRAGNDQPLPETGVPELVRLARAFNRLTAERRALSQVKDDFVAVVSHELRTPLTSINGALRLVNSGVSGPLPQKTGELVELALRNGERLQHLINDLLDFSKLSTGKLELAPVPCCLNGLIDEAVTGNGPMAEEHEVTLRNAYGRPLPVVLDPLRVRQLLDNLISNAIKFSPAGGRVTVSVERPQGDRLRLIVSDQGGGIPEAFADRLFDRFAQAEHGTMRAVQGTGLGLAICKELVELMGGRIGFYNQGGAHLWIEWPAGTETGIGGASSEGHP